MADLTVNINENVILNNQIIESSHTLTISSIAEVYRRIVKVQANQDATIATFQTDTHTTDGALDLENVKYIRVTNLEASNSCNLSLQVAASEDGTANMSTSILLEAGKSFMMGVPHDGIALRDDTASIATSLFDLESIIIDGTANAITVEVFVASVSS